MAFTPTTPTSGKIKQPDADRVLDKFHILSAKFCMAPGKPHRTSMSLEWTEGFMRNGKYVAVNTKKGFWDGKVDSDLIAALNMETTGGSMYNEMKTALWDFLQTKNLIGEGSIS